MAVAPWGGGGFGLWERPAKNLVEPPSHGGCSTGVLPQLRPRIQKQREPVRPHWAGHKDNMRSSQFEYVRDSGQGGGHLAEEQPFVSTTV